MKLNLVEKYCKGCGFCIEICPNDVLTESNRLNKKGYVLPEPQYPEKCIFCKKCELICPEMALSIEKEDSD